MFQTNDFEITIFFKDGTKQTGIRRHETINDPVEIRKLVSAKMKGTPGIDMIRVDPTAKALGKYAKPLE